MKKIIAIATVLTVAVMVAGPGPAQGATIEELQATIAQLQAQLNTALAQLAALGGGTGVGVSCTFTRSLYPGMSGADVKCLQQYLNDAGNTVAASGPGSAGNETEYYGSLTQAAVGAWQDANGVAYGAYRGYFGPVSQAKYNVLAAAGEEEEEEEEEEEDGEATEGSLIATIGSTPSSGVEVYVKTDDTAVASVDVKATGSDILINRFDLKFNKRPWLYISKVTVTDGTTSKSMDVTEANTSEVTVGSHYNVRVEGLNFNIEKDAAKTNLTVKVDAVSSLPGSTTSQAVILTIIANAIRGADGVGINQYAPTGQLSTRTFTVKEGDTANLEITANLDNPKARNIIVQETAETTGVVLAKINAKATNRDAIIRTVKFRDTTASGTLKAVYLYDEDDTLLSSTSSIVSATSTLADVDYTVPKDTTKVLTLKADINKCDWNFAEGQAATSTIYVEANADGFDAEDATTFATATVTGSTVAPGVAYFYKKAPSFALVSASISSVSVATTSIVYNGKADARIKINLTANGGDIYFASSTSNDVTATSSIGASTTIIESISTNAEDSSAGNYVIHSGDTKWIEIYAQLTGVNDVPQDLAAYTYITNLKWDDTDATAAATFENQTWALTDFKTGSAVFEYIR